MMTMMMWIFLLLQLCVATLSLSLRLQRRFESYNGIDREKCFVFGFWFLMEFSLLFFSPLFFFYFPLCNYCSLEKILVLVSGSMRTVLYKL